MTNFLNEDAAHQQLPNNLWYGVFSEDLIDLGDKAFVILPDLSRDNKFGPCFWQSRDNATFPNRGDRCCVMFDNRGQAWILAWWPFSN